MNVREWGIALLCTAIPGDPLTPLTPAQLRTLGRRVRTMRAPVQPRDQLRAAHLLPLGYSEAEAEHICALLAREARLERYLRRGWDYGIYPLTRLAPEYPPRLWQQLGMEAPPILFASGNADLLTQSAISVVGSRALRERGSTFAWKVGCLAAKEGKVLISGNAQGADRTAQEACLRAGGSVIAFVADDLRRHPPQDKGRQLVISESGYDLPFSSARALHRNHLIHALGEKTFVAQCELGRGGTWSGTTENLRREWSAVYICNDGSPAMRALCERGAIALSPHELTAL